MREIHATWMRGGTSKCWVFRREDLQVPDLSVDEVLLRLYGSPDHRQVDGLGGGTSTTSKAVILAPSTTPDVDVEYTFAQIGIEEAKVDWSSNCGNCSAVVASFAIREGWVAVGAPETSVRVLNTNTGQLIVQHVPTPHGRLDEHASETIPGVPFPGAPVRMGFVDPAGRSTGHLFPSGQRSDRLPRSGVTVTLVDAGAPVVAVRAEEVGVRGDEDIAVLDAVPGLLARLDAVRREAGVLMGLAETPEAVARAVPKLAVVSAGGELHGQTTDLTVRMLSMGRFHPAVPVTGSVALTLAAGAHGTVVGDLVSGETAKGLRLGTPAGCVETFAEEHDGVPVVGVVRTYRRLAQGSVLLPDPPLMPTASAGPTPLTRPPLTGLASPGGTG